MPRTKDTTDADIAAFEKWAGKSKAAETPAPTEAAPSKPMTSPNVSGIPDPVGDFARGGLENFMTSHPVGRAPTDEEMDWQQRAGRGVAKGLAGDVVGARSLAGRMLPSLNPLLASVPESAPLKRAYRSMKEFSGRPDTSTAESFGRVGGGALPFAFAPVGKGAETVEGLMASSATARGGLEELVRQYNRMKLAGAATRAVEGAAVGGAAGAIQDPDNPEGAIPGMIGGAASPIVGTVARGPLGHYLGGLGLTEAAYNAAHHIFPNMPYHPWGAAIVWHASPIGKRLRRIGTKIVDEAGRLIGSIPPGLVGAAGGQAIGGGPANEQEQ